MFKLSSIQKTTITLCSAVVLLGVIFGIIANCTFSRLSNFEESYDNAKIYYEEEAIFYIDEMCNKTSLEEAIIVLSEYDYIFKVKCLSTKHCYQCTKYDAVVTDTIKGDIDETGNNIVLYQWVFFEKNDAESLILNSPDFSIPLKDETEYLVFCQKRNYYPEYQKTLNCNEYSIGLRSNVPSTFILNDTQKDYIDISRDKTYSDIKDKYYVCFSQESLDRINKVSSEIIAYYSK